MKEKNRLFHTADLALIWQVNNKNTLYTTIKRYVKKGILIPIHKGFYSTIPLDQIDSFRLISGCLHNFCYISCETVLFSYGAIFQKGNYITVNSETAKRILLSNHNYLVRKLKSQYLYNMSGIERIEDYFIASPERAVCDILHFNSHYHLDNPKVINWKKVREIQLEVGYL